MKNSRILKETLDSVKMNENEIESLIEKCVKLQKSDTEALNKKRRMMYRIASAAAVCAVLFAVGNINVFAGIRHSIADKFFSGSNKEKAYVSELVTKVDQSIALNDIVFTVEDFIFEESVGEGYYVLSISRTDKTAPKVGNVAGAAGMFAYTGYKIDDKVYQIALNEVIDGVHQTDNSINCRIGEQVEYEDSICIYTRFYTDAKQSEPEYVLYITEADAITNENFDEIVKNGEYITLGDAIEESIEFSNGKVKGVLNPFCLRLEWDGYSMPVKNISIGKTDGTIIPIIRDGEVVSENASITMTRRKGDNKGNSRYFTIKNIILMEDVKYIEIDGTRW